MTMFRSAFAFGFVFSVAASSAQANLLDTNMDFNMMVKRYTGTQTIPCPNGTAPTSKTAANNVPNFVTEQMVKAAFPYYNKPYPDAPGELTSQNGITIYRPNHGIAHAVRSAAVASDIMQMVLNNPAGGEMQTWLKTKLAEDPTYLQKIEMATLLHRSGRTDETDSMSGPPEKRQKEMAASASNFKEAAAVSGLKFSPTDLDNLANGIILDGGGNGNVDQDHISRLIRGAHNIELIRVGMKYGNDVPEAIPEFPAGGVDTLYKREALYLSTTGDQRQAGAGFTPPFYKLSSDPAALLQAMDDVRKANPLP
jgi:hypothetical protein